MWVYARRMLGGGGRRPGRICRRAARGRLLELLLRKSSKPVKRHKGSFYCRTRDVAQVRYPPGRILGTQTFRVAGVLHFTYTNCGSNVDENGYFVQVKRILRWTAGGDVEKIGRFQSWRSRSHGTFFCITSWGRC